MESKKIDQLIHNTKWSELSDGLRECENVESNAHTAYAKGMLIAYGPEDSNDIRQAAIYLKKACELDNKNATYKNILSAFLLDLGNVAEAHQFALDAYKVAPLNPMSSLALGKTLLAHNKEEEAYQSFKNALSTIPNDQTQFKTSVKNTILKLPITWNAPLLGKRLALTRITKKHFDFLLSSRKNDTFRNQYNFFHQTSEKAVHDNIASAKASPLENNKIEWVIEKDGRQIGIAALVDINFRNSRAELLIGFPDQCEGWLSLEATFLILEFAFKKLGLEKIYSYVYSDNTQSQKNTLHLGFTQEGVLRSHVKRPDTSESLDLIINGCLANEFLQNPKTSKLFARVLGRPLSEAP